MKEFIEKLICRLEEEKSKDICDDISCAECHKRYKTDCKDDCYIPMQMLVNDNTIEIINELAEEYINTSTDTSSGWIPCSERLPEKNQRCLISYKGNINSEGIEEKYVDIDRFEGTRFSFFGIDRVIAWQSLPAPYKEGE